MKWFLIVVATHQGSWLSKHDSKSQMPSLDVCLSVLSEIRIEQTEPGTKYAGGFVVAYCSQEKAQ